MGRSAFIARREGRYVFRTRLPPCLGPGSGSASLRIALHTADYPVAVRRAARVASWVLRMKAAISMEDALRELFPKLRELALEPVRDAEDLSERHAFLTTAFVVQARLRRARIDLDAVVPGWTDHFVALVRENARAGHALETASSIEAQVERKRNVDPLAYVQLVPGRLTPNPLVTDPPAAPPSTAGAGQQAPAADEVAGGMRLRLSAVLQRFLDFRATEDSDRRADSEVGPIIRFAIDLLEDPVMMDMTGDHLLKLKAAIPDIPTTRGFSPDDRASLYFRWNHVREIGWTAERGGKTVNLKRTSETTINTGWRIALTALWQFAIEHRFAFGPLPDFRISTKKNPGAVERDAFRDDELFKFLGAAPFVGCAGRSRPWTAGKCFHQGYFYWAELISLLCGMRPGETAQLRCRDILDLYGKPHFRYARFGEKQQEAAQHTPQTGGNDAKSQNAFRWISIHWLVVRLGIIERRDAIMAAFVERKIAEAGGRGRVSDDQVSAIEVEAGEQWLFPDWPVYVKKTGEIKWAHVVSKAFAYGRSKLKMERAGFTQYSARHSFKGFLDDIRGLSERSRKILLGHSTKHDVTSRYGPKMVTEQQSDVVQKLSSRAIWRLARILIRAKRKAERGQLDVIEAWRVDERSGDEKFQAALARRAKLYR
jgi:integrase